MNSAQQLISMLPTVRTRLGGLWMTAASQIVLLGFCLTNGAAAVIPGHVEAWGANGLGQATPPAGLDGVLAIAAGGDHSLALLTNGTVVAWGANYGGQTAVPQGLSNVVAIAAALHSVALKSDGTVVVWGGSPAVTNVPPGLSSVAAIAAGNIAGNSYTLALRSNGTVAAWGLMDFVTNLPAGLTNVVRVAAGLSHALALKSDGSVVGWGENNVGQATPPPGLAGVVAIAAGQFSSLAVTSDGHVVKWGSFDNVPAGLDGVVDVKLGAGHAIALRSNGVVVAWGENFFGQGAVPEGLNGVTAISAGGNFNLVLTPRPLVMSISAPIVANVGANVTFSVSASGLQLRYQWRHNGSDISGGINSSLMLTNLQTSDSGIYAVLVSNPYGSVLSPGTSLLFPLPVITSQPQSMTRYRGEDASFTVAANGLAPLHYQWLMAGSNLTGSTQTILTLLNLRSTNAGDYQAVVTDAAGGSVTSAVASLTIIDPTGVKSVALGPAVDTSIYSSGGNPQGMGSILAGTRNNGISDRGLLRFNLGSIPPTAVIQPATVRLAVIKVPRDPADSNFSLYRMFKPWDLNASWANASAGLPWAAPGGLPGLDYSSSSSATRFVTGGGPYDFGPSSQLAADVQTWVANAATNQGWMLKTESEGSLGSARHFGSSESAQPPQLLLMYSTPAPAARLANVRAQAGNLVFSFDGAPGWIYRIECQANVQGASWTTLTNVPAGSATNAIVIATPLMPPRRFYRVIAE